MKKIRLILFALVILSLLSFSALAAATITYTVNNVNDDGLYKITATAYNEGGKYTAFKSDVTFNLALFKPAHKSTGALVDVAANVNTKAPIKVTSYYDPDDDETVTAVMPRNPQWDVSGDKVELIVEQGMVGGLDIGDGLMMMEFYFRFADGKTVEDITPADFEVDYVKYSDKITGEETFRNTVGPNTLIVKNRTYQTSVSLSDGTGMQGETISIPLTIKNNPGISDFSFSLDYDDTALTFSSLEAGDLFTASEIASESAPFALASSSDKKGDDVVVNLKFTINENCTPGEYDVTLSNLQVGNTYGETIYDIAEGKGTVSVSENPALTFESTRTSARAVTYKKRAAIRFMAKSSQYNEFDSFGFLLSRADTMEANGYTELTHDVKSGTTPLYIEAFCVDDSHNRIYSEDNEGARTYSMLASNIPADKTDTVFVARPFATFDTSSGTVTAYGVEKSACYDNLPTT